MRIALITQWFLPKVGGAEIFAYELGRRLSTRGHGVHIVTIRIPGTKRYEYYNGINIHRYPMYDQNLLWMIAKHAFKNFPSHTSLFSIPVLGNLIYRERIDLFNLHYVFPSGLAVILTKKVTGVPVLFTAVGREILDLPRWLLKMVIENADGCTCISPFLREKVEDICPNSNPRVTPLGVDTDQFNPKVDGSGVREKYEGPLILAVQRLEPLKAVEVLIKAAPAVLRAVPAAKFLIVDAGGEAGYVSYLKELVQKLRLNDNVKFEGFVPRRSLNKYYAACDLFVCPSVFETFGAVYIEAMASGRPVVASNVTAAPSIVKDGETGILVPPRDHEALAKAVIELLINDNLRMKMGNNARKWAESFGWDNVVDDFLEAYRAIL